MRVRYFAIPFLAILVAFLWLVIASWTSPYVLTGSYTDGTLGWEMHECRTIIGGYDHFRTVRYYPTGELMFVNDSPGRDGGEFYWRKDGTRYANRATWIKDHSELLFECEPDGERPQYPLLDWISSLHP